MIANPRVPVSKTAAAGRKWEKPRKNRRKRRSSWWCELFVCSFPCRVRDPCQGSGAGVTVEVTSSAAGSVHGLLDEGSGFVLARNRQQHPPHHHQRQRHHHHHHRQLLQLPATTTYTNANATNTGPSTSSTPLATERLITFGKIRRYRETSAAASPSSRTSPATPSAPRVQRLDMTTTTTATRTMFLTGATRDNGGFT
uniref:Uncharacterized protein n=1 Tax=Anopheles farauti TaxID=69004 RepID=A0A182QHK6_9DIPT